MPDAGEVLRSYYARLDGDAEGDPMELVADAIEVAFNVPGIAFSGGRAELQAYVDRRDPVANPRRHHLVERSSHGPISIALGEARHGDQVLGTFVVAAQVDGDGLLDRYLVTYSLGMTFSTTKTRA